MRKPIERVIGDVAMINWGASPRVMVAIKRDSDASTGAALQVSISPERTFSVGTRADLDVVAVELPRKEGGSNATRIEIPELVLGDPYQTISEEVTFEEMELLVSYAYAGVLNGPYVHTKVYLSRSDQLVLAVELKNAPVFIFNVSEENDKALTLKVGEDTRTGHEFEDPAVYVEVPNGVFGDIRSKGAER
jgi:hypothetical protein